MVQERTLILSEKQILQKIRRIAYQIYESNSEEKQLVVVAIEQRGSKLADMLVEVLKEIAPFAIERLDLSIDKRQPLRLPKLSGDEALMADRAVVLVDDVLNSGRTLMYAASHLLQQPIRRLVTVVLVDRLHRRFPIKADFVGITLSTTLQDHIAVEFDGVGVRAYLE